MKHKQIKTVHEYTWHCWVNLVLALLWMWFGIISFHPCPSRLPRWHWNNHTNFAMPVGRPWRICGNESHEYTNIDDIIPYQIKIKQYTYFAGCMTTISHIDKMTSWGYGTGSVSSMVVIHRIECVHTFVSFILQFWVDRCRSFSRTLYFDWARGYKFVSLLVQVMAIGHPKLWLFG